MMGNSAIRMLLETRMPAIMTSPISDMMFKVVPVVVRISKTPATLKQASHVLLSRFVPPISDGDNSQNRSN
jgi:hypothetical protein